MPPGGSHFKNHWYSSEYYRYFVISHIHTLGIYNIVLNILVHLSDNNLEPSMVTKFDFSFIPTGQSLHVVVLRSWIDPKRLKILILLSVPLCC